MNGPRTTVQTPAPRLTHLQQARHKPLELAHCCLLPNTVVAQSDLHPLVPELLPVVDVGSTTLSSCSVALAGQAMLEH